MLAVSRTHHLPLNPAGLVRLGAVIRGTDETIGRNRQVQPGEPSIGPALLAHLAGLALGATLILGTTIVAALGLSLVLP
jgi:hypothetical protein